jgi:hypothetical protein
MAAVVVVVVRERLTVLLVVQAAVVQVFNQVQAVLQINLERAQLHFMEMQAVMD